MRSCPCLRPAAALCASLIAAAAPGATETRLILPPDWRDAVGEAQLVVAFGPLDEDVVEEMLEDPTRYALQAVAVTAAVTAAVTPFGVASAAGTTAQFAAPPLALMAGGVALIGSMQHDARLARAAERTTAALRGEFAARRAAAGLDQAFAETLQHRLAALPWLKFSGAPQVRRSVDEGAVEAALHEAKPRAPGALLLVVVRDQIPITLAGEFVMVEARLYSPAVARRATWRTRWMERNSPTDKGDVPLVKATVASLVTSVPIQDLYAKPTGYIEPRIAATTLRYDEMLVATEDHDTRRAIRTARNAALERIRGPWQVDELADHMAGSWTAAGRADAYERFVMAGQADLADRIAAALASEPEVRP